MKIEVKDISKNFDKIEIIKKSNLTFESGKIYGLIGRNGSGKSVFLKMICGFYEPSSGEILFDGINVIKEKGFPKNTRALIEKPCFIPDLTGFENLKLLASIENKIDDETINQTLHKLKLLKDANKKYSKYSLGMKQKLGIAQVLMEDPDIIILDEPFNGVENDTASKIRNILLEEKKKNKIIIIASHIKEDIYGLADDVFEFDDGNITKVN